MIDFSQAFYDFNNAISLSPTEIKYLRRARSAITEKIKRYFAAYIDLPEPSFIGQGSFTMGTIVKPLHGSFDIDIGVYINGQSNWRNNWPKPETISNWLKNALIDHTSIAPINKKACLRVVYRPIRKSSKIYYHVDLPIYIEYNNLLSIKKTRIGINGDRRWEEKSDPKGFTDWFKEVSQENENDKAQFKRVVKYLKAWKDQNKKRSKFPNGMLLTVLAGKSYNPNSRDDVAFYNTVRRIYNKLTWSNNVGKPVEPFNNLGSYLTSSQWEKFHITLGYLVDDLKLVLRLEDYSYGIDILRNQFGERF